MIVNDENEMFQSDNGNERMSEFNIRGDKMSEPVMEESRGIRYYVSCSEGQTGPKNRSDQVESTRSEFTRRLPKQAARIVAQELS